MLKISNYVRMGTDYEKIPIYVRVTNGRAFDLRARTKETCFSNQWDAENKKLKEKFLVEEKGKLIEKRDALTRAMILESRNTNSRLLGLEKKIETAFKENEGSKIDTEWLKNIIDPPIEDENNIPDDFIEYCDIFIEQKKNSISKDYIVKVNSIKKIIADFLEYNKEKILKISDIDIQFGSELENFCLEIKGYSKNYIEKNLKFIKTIAYHSEMNGIALNHQIRKIKYKGEKTVFQILNLEELDKIEKCQISDKLLDEVRDWLIISVFSGQRISDFMKFTSEMITSFDDKKGKKVYFIDFIQEKTKKQIHLPLHPKILKILEKRGFEFPPKITEQKYNELIKEVCRRAKIDEICYGGKNINERKVMDYYPKYELITSHIGRRSFATNNYGIIPTPLLMVATGHSTENMFLKYIGKIDNQQANALANYFYD